VETHKPHFAVIDVETTGFNAAGHDRVVELAIVRLDADLKPIDEFTTLLNPGRDIGRTDIHGIRASDVVDAPTFDEVIGDVAQRIAEVILVGHQIQFDLRFLEAEFGRAGHSWHTFPTLCTLDLAHRFLPEIPSRKLAHCCESCGVQIEDAHSALGDARATALLLTKFLPELCSQKGLIPSLLVQAASRNWTSRAPSGRVHPRNTSVRRPSEYRTYLARLIERTLGDESRNAHEGEYLTVLDRALEDQIVSQDEANALIQLAQSLGMNRSEVLNAHRAYLESLTSEALRDGKVSDSEKADLEAVCDVLDLNRAVLEEFLEHPSPNFQSTSSDLRGMTVCFTGEFECLHKGMRITRQVAEEFAEKAGLFVKSSVTKQLGLLVVADPFTQSSKAKKAREYGVRIIAERVFWRSIEVVVE
jgi:DNA polymerase-3 subunit epsilon